MASTLVCERLPPPPPAVVVVPVAWVWAWVAVVGVGVPGVLSPGDSGPPPEPAASAVPLPQSSAAAPAASSAHTSASATTDDLRGTQDTNVIVGQCGVGCRWRSATTPTSLSGRPRAAAPSPECSAGSCRAPRSPDAPRG